MEDRLTMGMSAASLDDLADNLKEETSQISTVLQACCNSTARRGKKGFSSPYSCKNCFVRIRKEHFQERLLTSPPCWLRPPISPIFLKRSLVLPILLFSSICLHCSYLYSFLRQPFCFLAFLFLWDGFSCYLRP